MSLDLQGVEPHRRAGVALDHVHVEKQRWHRDNRRPAALSAREALTALQFEANLVWVAAGNVRAGVTLTDEDFARLTHACRNIDAIVDEVGHVAR